MKKKLLLLVLILLALAQLKRIDKTNPPLIEGDDLFAIHAAPDHIEDLVRTACYDCHSHETSYPWYSNFSPVSWWLQDHIEEGRRHLDFSTWKGLSASDADHALEECVEVLEEKEMPMLPYMIAHQDAWLDDAQREELAQFFQSLR